MDKEIKSLKQQIDELNKIIEKLKLQIAEYEKKEENEKRMQIYEGNKASSDGQTRVVDMGTTTKEIGGTVITTKTTQISYKRKRLDKKSEQK